VELEDLFVSVLIVGLSLINAAIPIGAWRQSSDRRYLWLSLANAFLAILGAIWAYGVLPVAPPSWTAPQFPIPLIVLAAVVAFLLAALWPRRS
jgi:hypothetical protein